MITDKAPWAERDNFQGEITKDGLIVFTAGYNSREALNDGHFNPSISLSDSCYLVFSSHLLSLCYF